MKANNNNNYSKRDETSYLEMDELYDAVFTVENAYLDGVDSSVNSGPETQDMQDTSRGATAAATPRHSKLKLRTKSLPPVRTSSSSDD